jgi:hypothetical protein
VSVSKSFKGILTLACRVDGADSAVGSTDINGKVWLEALSLPCESHCLCHTFTEAVLPTVQDVVVIGTGAFGCEAMREAVRNGAASVTVITRRSNRLVSHLCMPALVTVPMPQGRSMHVCVPQVDCALLSDHLLLCALHDASRPLGLEVRALQGLADALPLPAVWHGKPHPHRRPQGHGLPWCGSFASCVDRAACMPVTCIHWNSVIFHCIQVT